MQKHYAEHLTSRAHGIGDMEVYLASDADRALSQAASAVEAKGAEIVGLKERVAELEKALEEIEANCNGYGDIAGWACRRAAKALRPESSTD